MVNIDKDNTFASGCVIYTGKYPSFVPEESIDCKANLDAILGIIGNKINDVSDSLNFTTLNKSCFDFNPETVTFKELTRIKLKKICEQEEIIDKLQTILSGTNVGNLKVNIDLGCLVSTADPCDNGDIYTLSQILKIFRSELCVLKDKATEVCDNVGTSGTSGTSGEVGGTSGTSGTGGAGGTSGTSGSSGTSGGGGTGGGRLGIRVDLRMDIIEAAVCGATAQVTYLDGVADIATGVIIYDDINLTTPHQGDLFVSNLGGTLYNLDVTTGEVGLPTGNSC